MATASRVPAGWPIVGWAALGILTMIAAILLTAGADEPGIRMVVRATARTSVVLFSVAFVASSVRRLWPTPATAWMLANRRYLGVSFGVSHLAHLLALLALAGWSLRTFVEKAPPPTLVLGGIGYLFLTAMVATSFDRTAAWLGPRRWRQLHTTGMYFLWTIFVLTFGPQVARAPIYVPFVAALVAALALRLAGPRLARRRALA